ncbi:MAG: hypothetical protein R3F43_08415 [bacterium]
MKVEALRAQGRKAALGALFAGWGIPTAAAVLGAAGLGPQVIASGRGRWPRPGAGPRPRRPARRLRPARPPGLPGGGRGGAQAFLEDVIEALRMALVLTGCRRPAELAAVPRVLGPRLAAWQRTWEAA